MQAIICPSNYKKAISLGIFYKDFRNLKTKWIDCNSGSKENPQNFILDDKINQDSLIFLQYTSGSTAFPKGIFAFIIKLAGVMVSSATLFHNLSLLSDNLGLSSSTVTVYWLPHFHGILWCVSHLCQIFAWSVDTC